MSATHNRLAPEHIVVLGNSSSAWMTCAFFAKHFAHCSTRITLITNNEAESPDFPVSVLPEFSWFLQFLNISEKHFMSGTSATFKLADVYTGWRQLHHYFFHAHGHYGIAKEYIPFYQVYLRLRQEAANQGKAINAYHDYSLAALAAMNDKFVHPNDDPKSIFSSLSYSWHFNEQQFAKLLQNYCKSKKVTQLTAKVSEIILINDALDGERIGAVAVGDKKIHADLFVDCSHNRTIAHFAESNCGASINDWSHLIRTDLLIRAVTTNNVRSRACDAVNAEAHGIEFIQPIHHQTGLSFYTHSSFHQDANSPLSKNMAQLTDVTKTFERNFSTSPSWIYNNIAVGPAAFNINSPVISSVDTTWLALKQLLKYTPQAQPCPSLAAEFNHLMAQTYIRIKDYVVLLRALATGSNGNFWINDMKNSYSQEMTHKLALFDLRGRICGQEEGAFTTAQQITLLVGLGYQPQKPDALAAQVPIEPLAHHANRIQRAILNSLPQMPSHADYLQRYLTSNSM